MSDLWPDDLTSENLVAPVTILREQGERLGERTRNIVVGAVEAVDLYEYMDDIPVAIDSKNFSYGFYIKSSSINYTYKLFDINHSIDLYPVQINLDSGVARELHLGTAFISAENEFEFVEALRKILNTEKTKRIIRAILAQSPAWSQIKKDDDLPF